MHSTSGLQKRNVTKDLRENSGDNDNETSPLVDEWPSKDDLKLTLMDELLLLVMNPRGYVSAWNDNVSRALRGCILIELWMRGKIELEPAGLRKKKLPLRMVVVKNATITENSMLNEALKLIKSNPPYTVPDWIAYLSGETWNPLKIKLHMRHVRERLFKDLVERGFLSTVKANYWVVDYNYHPIKDFGAMKQLRNKVKSALLENYSNDLRRMDKRTLSLLILAQYSGGIEGCLSGISSEQERLALKRIESIEEADFESESQRGNDSELLWAVFVALNDPNLL